MKTTWACIVGFLVLISCQSPSNEQSTESQSVTPEPTQIAEPAPGTTVIEDSATVENDIEEPEKAPVKMARDTTAARKDSTKMDPRIKRILDEKLIKNKKDTNN